LEECARQGVELLWLPPTWRWLADPAAVMNARHGLQWAVRPEHAATAIQALLDTGWRPSQICLPKRLIPGFVRGAKHLLLQHGQKEFLMLTWGLEWWFGERVAEVWSRAAYLDFGKQPVLALERTDALEFALRQAPAASVLGDMADLLAIAAEAPAIEWTRLSHALQSAPLSAERVAMLPQLQVFLDAWNACLERIEACAKTPSNNPSTAISNSLWGRYRQDWQRYRLAWGDEYRLDTALLQLPGYLMARWRLTDPRQLSKGLSGWLRLVKY
jgi:hypothetical protein